MLCCLLCAALACCAVGGLGTACCGGLTTAAPACCAGGLGTACFAGPLRCLCLWSCLRAVLAMAAQYVLLA